MAAGAAIGRAVFVKLLLVALLVPPFCFLYLTLLGFLIAPRHARVGRALMGAGLIGLLLFSLPVVADALLLSLERNLPTQPPADAMPQAIVVLGGDVHRTGEPPFVRDGPLTLERLQAGAALHRRTGLPLLVTGGVVVPDAVTVGALMADSLRDDFRVPVEWTETASRDTWENATFSAEMLKRRDIRSVYVVTHAWHMRRALLAFRRAGLIATAAPTSLDAMAAPLLIEQMPRVSSWQKSYFAFHEWIGWAWYALR